LAELGTTEEAVYHKIKKGAVKYPASLAPEMVLLFMRLFSLNPQERPSAEEVLSLIQLAGFRFSLSN
jgi:hypothetical protein